MKGEVSAAVREDGQLAWACRGCGAGPPLLSDADARFNVATCLLNGRGVALDDMAVAEYPKITCHAGHLAAMNGYGTCLALGADGALLRRRGRTIARSRTRCSGQPSANWGPPFARVAAYPERMVIARRPATLPCTDPAEKRRKRRGLCW
jgi:hypothetical protein